MRRLCRTVVLLSLLGQVLLAGQAIAMGRCHDMSGDGFAAVHGSNAGHRAGVSDPGAAHQPHSDAATPHLGLSCHCADGIQCGQLAALFQEPSLAPSPAAPRGRRPDLAIAATSLAHRREPFRPPIRRA